MAKSVFTRRSALKLAAFGGAAAAVGLAKPAILRAQNYPSRPINVIVPFATGGYNDRLARASAPFLEKELGQPLVIVNQPGGNTILGHSYFLQQPQDGYSILCTSASPYIPLSILLYNAPYKAEDFWMINLPSRDITLAATAADKPIDSFAQVLESLKKDPASVSLGVQPASGDYVNMMLAIQAAGIDRNALRIVTYDGGGPARNATAGGHVDVGFVGGEGFLPLKDKIKPLASFSAEPMKGFENAPTITQIGQEAGFQAEFVDGSQRGWAVSSALKNDQPEIYNTLAGAIERASKSPEMIKALEGQELATTWYGPEASNEAYMQSFQTLEKHVGLLKGS